MKTNLDLFTLRNSRSAAILYRALQKICLTKLSLIELVKLKAIIADVIKRDDFKNVPEHLLMMYSQMLSRRPLDLPRIDVEDKRIRHVSVLFSSGADKTHLSVIYNFIAFLVLMPQLHRVDLIISSETVPKFWSDPVKGAQKEKIEMAAQEAITEFFGAATAPQEYLNKLNICFAPDIDELSAAIGNVVIRYEGSVPHLNFRMCTHSIFEQRPVLGTVGTAVIAGLQDVDVLLTPARGPFDPQKIHYLRPLKEFPNKETLLKISPKCKQKRVLLSGYANDKLARGLADLTKKDWAALSTLFEGDPDMHWHLFGAKDTAPVWSAFPTNFMKDFSSRISVSNMIDLTNVWQDGFAFLALPGVGGGATTAKLALRDGVPILVCLNGEHDISNMFPNPAHDIDFLALVEHLSAWVSDPEKRLDVLLRQVADINQRANLEAKSNELYAIFETASAQFGKRSKN